MSGNTPSLFSCLVTLLLRHCQTRHGRTKAAPRNKQPRRATPARFPLTAPRYPAPALPPEPGIAGAARYAARSMAGSQPVPVSNPAARSAISPFLRLAMFSAAAVPFPSVTASRMSVFGTRPR